GPACGQARARACCCLCRWWRIAGHRPSAGSEPMSETRSALFSRARLIWVVVLVVVLGGLWYLLSRSPSAPVGMMSRSAWDGPVAVRTANAEAGELSVQIKAIGTVTPLNTVTVRSRVEGELARVLFEEGQEVEKGTLLAEIDPSSYRVQLA